MKTVTPSKDELVRLLESTGWTRVDRDGLEWAHPKREGAVYSLSAAVRREQRKA